MRWVHTSDMHGAEMCRDLKLRLGADVLSDGGDSLQGAAWTQYAHEVGGSNGSHLIAVEMNEMGYDFAVCGNHDVAEGKEVLEKWAKDCAFPVLGANVDAEGVKPYIVMQKEGFRIGVVGLMYWNMVECAAKWVKIVREQEDVDIVVGVFHSGWEGGMDGENLTKRVAEDVDGFDLILYGHDHHAAIHRVKSKVGREVLCVGAGCCGMTAAVVEVNSEEVTDENTVGWKIEAEIVDLSVIEGRMESRETRFPQYKEWLSTPICLLTEKIEEKDSFFGPSTFISLFHQMQMRVTAADVSFASPVNYDSVVEDGELTMRDLFTLYRFTTDVCAVRMTGREVHDVLERSYALWANQMNDSEDDALLMDYILDGGKRKGLKNISLNMLSAEGIDYVVDVTKPAGEKVSITSMSDGREFDAQATYLVAVNSYHCAGGGGMFPKGLKPERIAGDSRMLLQEYLQEQMVYTPKRESNWGFIPKDWTADALTRDRAILFGKE